MREKFTHFRFYSKEDILYVTRKRKFETRLGEIIACLSTPDELESWLSSSPAQFILFGIPEDIGVKGNHGIGGADSAWIPFLQSFLNIQSNDFLSGDNLALLGHFDFGDLKYLIENHAKSDEEKIDAYRHAVNTIDDEVEHLTKLITSKRKIPIVIGGGHNNSYPLIKGAAKGLHQAGVLPIAQINCINLDAHTDYRPAEGRHSGNGFRYAEEDGFLQKYCVIGAHEGYLPQNIWMDFVNNPFFDLITFEDIFIHEKRSFIQAVAHATGFTEDNYSGIEIDLDCISNVLSSAATPCGISELQARQFISFAGTDAKPAYLHISEGAVQLADGRKNESTGKLISYLVQDFVKARL